MKALTALAVVGWGLLAVAATASTTPPAHAADTSPERAAILALLASDAKAADAGFTEFSASRGAELFARKASGGKPETPSCTTCHSSDPTRTGQTRAGKDIEPMAVSVTPKRFTDAEKVAKRFERNCNSVLGRACTATEKGDFLTFMSNR